MGNDIKISGLGYDDNDDYDDYENTDGANAGILKHYEANHHDLILSSGYGAHVVAGETYTLSDLKWVGNTYFVFSDPILPKTEGIPSTEEYIDLILKMGDAEKTCRVTAGDSRKFVSHKGIAFGAALGDCGNALWELALEAGCGIKDYSPCPTTTTTTSPAKTTNTAATADPCKGCGTYDWRCWTDSDPFGGLGCNLCGKPQCRLCDEDPNTDFISCSAIPTKTTAKTTTTTTTITTTAADPCNGCGTYDWRCWTDSDPHGGLGCNLCGKPKCRLCDENPDTDFISCNEILTNQ